MKYSPSHEWIVLDDKVATIGITNFGQQELGEIVFIELPTLGQDIEKDQVACVLESTKAAVDVTSPITGKVIEVNESLKTHPSLVNEKPEQEGWIYKLEVKDTDEYESLLLEEEYKKLIKVT